MVCSPDGVTDFFDTVAGVLQRYTLVPYIYNLARLHILDINRSNKKTILHKKWQETDDILQKLR